eukprot:968067_1
MAKLWISFLTLFLLHTIQSVPSNAPSNAPTHAPSIAPIFRFTPTNAPTLTQKYVYVRSTGCDWGDCGSPPIFRFTPTNAPTLTQKYVYVRSTGCDWGDCGSPATSYPFMCLHQVEQIGAAYDQCCNYTYTSQGPSPNPSVAPTTPTSYPTKQPTALPTNVPTLAPTSAPTNTPTYQPTCETIEYGWNCFLGQIDGNPWGQCHVYNANGEFFMG